MDNKDLAKALRAYRVNKTPIEHKMNILDKAADLLDKVEKAETDLSGLRQRSKAAHDYLSAIMPRLNSILELLEDYDQPTTSERE